MQVLLFCCSFKSICDQVEKNKLDWLLGSRQKHWIRDNQYPDFFLFLFFPLAYLLPWSWKYHARSLQEMKPSSYLKNPCSVPRHYIEKNGRGYYPNVFTVYSCNNNNNSNKQLDPSTLQKSSKHKSLGQIPSCKFGKHYHLKLKSSKVPTSLELSMSHFQKWCKHLEI